MVILGISTIVMPTLDKGTEVQRGSTIVPRVTTLVSSKAGLCLWVI
jgi:hypothetical protein